ncbi:MAG TPA: glycosyltransferase [Collinsella intestinalis]|nr:glycosyltransferase [Collinsella intestinalis]
MTELSGDTRPLVSFVVIAHNVETYIQRCLRSVREQVGASFEVIVVDDASTDATLDLIEAEAGEDGRLRVVKRLQNGGAHLARKTGVLYSSGQFVYFVDGDDEVNPHFLELVVGLIRHRRAEIYRLGCCVVTHGSEDESARILVDRALNDSSGTVKGDEILSRSFGGVGVKREPWRMVSCLYEGEFCRAAFTAMTSVQIGYMEDAYEFFVLASRASVLENAVDCIGQIYNLGAGRSGFGFMGLNAFISRQREVHDLVREVSLFAEIDGRVALRQCAEWFERECLRTLSNEWTVRLRLSDQVDAVPVLVETWGAVSACRALASPLMGRATWVLQDDGRLDDPIFHAWRTEWDRMVAGVTLPHERGFTDLATVLSQVDAHIAMRDAADRARVEREAEAWRTAEARSRRWYMRITNALLPQGSKFRRALAAAFRELRR